MSNQDEEGKKKEDPKAEDSSVEEAVESDSEEVQTAAGEDGDEASEEESVELTVQDGGKFDPEALLNGNGTNGNGRADDGIYIDDMYGDWFLDYASYVILERAVPHADDGLKPVQRRILHSM
ncbi:MAG: hypothetical protein VCA18_09770, partial [Opitutales bacterium]